MVIASDQEGMPVENLSISFVVSGGTSKGSLSSGVTGYSLDFANVNSGHLQTGGVGSQLPTTFKAALTDSFGSPVSGQRIRFLSFGPTLGHFSGLNFHDVFTDVNGVAESSLFTLGTQSGVHSINAYLVNDSAVSRVFSTTATVSTNSLIDPNLSHFAFSVPQVAADGFSTVETFIHIKDQYNNYIPNASLSGLISLNITPSLLGSSWL